MEIFFDFDAPLTINQAIYLLENNLVAIDEVDSSTGEIQLSSVDPKLLKRFEEFLISYDIVTLDNNEENTDSIEKDVITDFLENFNMNTASDDVIYLISLLSGYYDFASNSNYQDIITAIEETLDYIYDAPEGTNATNFAWSEFIYPAYKHVHNLYIAHSHNDDNNNGYEKIKNKESVQKTTMKNANNNSREDQLKMEVYNDVFQRLKLFIEMEAEPKDIKELKDFLNQLLIFISSSNTDSNDSTTGTPSNKNKCLSAKYDLLLQEIEKGNIFDLSHDTKELEDYIRQLLDFLASSNTQD